MKALKILIITFISLVLWNLPSYIFGIPGLTLTEQRTISIFVFGALMWLTESIPSWATSVVIIVLLLYTCSDSSLRIFTEYDPATLGTLVSSKGILGSIGDPVIMLLFGGFIIAIAASKLKIDVVLARTILAPFGSRSENVLLGILLITGFFSMFISNSTTAAIMFTFIAPLLKQLPEDGKGRIALAMAIPVGANIGGIGTPIGTPPNAIALTALSQVDGQNLGNDFGVWMMVMFPIALILLFIGWFVLLHMFPFTKKTIEINIDQKPENTWQTYIFYITFATTISFWILDKVSGVNSNMVGLLPVAVFCACGIITRRDLEKVSWSVLLMIAGGIALGFAMEETNLAKDIINNINFSSWPAIMILIGSGLICYLLSNFISNTATAGLLIPILTVVGSALTGTLSPLGGVMPLIMGIALSASLAMLLPVSTPSNAIVHSTGLIEQKDMMKVGAIVGGLGMVIGYAMLIIAGKMGVI